MSLSKTGYNQHEQLGSRLDSPAAQPDNYPRKNDDYLIRVEKAFTDSQAPVMSPNFQLDLFTLPY